MKLSINSHIQKAFGDNAKWIDLRERGVKGIVFRSMDSKLKRYDEIHLGKFISNGIYKEVLKELYGYFHSNKKILLEVEYGVLKLNLVTSTDHIKIHKTFTIGLFYGRSLEDIVASATENISKQALCDINSKVETVQHFFENYKADELDTANKVEKAVESFANISGIDITAKDANLIRKYSSNFAR